MPFSFSFSMRFFMPKASQTRRLLFDLQTCSFGGEEEKQTRLTRDTLNSKLPFILNLRCHKALGNLSTLHLVRRLRDRDTLLAYVKYTYTFWKLRRKCRAEWKGTNYGSVLHCQMRHPGLTAGFCVPNKVLQGQYAGLFSKRKAMESNLNCHYAALYPNSKLD